MESRNNNFGKTLRNLGLIIGIPLVIAVILWMFMSGGKSNKDKVYSDYLDYFEKGQVEYYDLNLGSGEVSILLKEAYREDVNGDGKTTEADVITYSVPNVSLFLEDIQEYDGCAARSDCRIAGVVLDRQHDPVVADDRLVCSHVDHDAPLAGQYGWR